MKRIGIFLCQCEYHQITLKEQQQISAVFSKEKRVAYISPHVKLCGDPILTEFGQIIKNENLDAAILTSCLPSLHINNLPDIHSRLGLSSNLVALVEIPKATNGDRPQVVEKLINAIKEKITEFEMTESVELAASATKSITKNVMVIGAGVSGIHVALDVADAGYDVYLMDKSSSIGGHMVQISEVFPTLDCPQCILTPKMVACNQHPNIHILAYSEIEDIQGQVGDFQVTLKHKTAYIDWEKCTGCGECNTVCTVAYPSDFDRQVVDQKAAYKPFAQAVPNKLVIEKKGQSPCKFGCPIDCNAQGYVALIANGHYQEAISLVRETIPFPGVLGRVCNHRCQDYCLRKDVDEPVAIKFLKRFISDWEMKQNLRPIKKPETIHPEKFAIIGAGPAGLTAAYDLARAGYMSTIFEAMPAAGGMLRWGIPDYRLPRDILDYEIQLVT